MVARTRTVIAHNVLTALKRIALRLAALADRIALWKEAMRLLPIVP